MASSTPSSTPLSAPASAGAETNLGAPASTTKPAGAKRGGKKADKADKPASGIEKLTHDSKGQTYLPGSERLGVKALVDCVLEREKFKKQKKQADEKLTSINTQLRGLIETHKAAFEEDAKGNLVYDDGDIEIHVVAKEEKITTKLKKDGESANATAGTGAKRGGKKKVTVEDVY